MQMSISPKPWFHSISTSMVIDHIGVLEYWSKPFKHKTMESESREAGKVRGSLYLVFHVYRYESIGLLPSSYSHTYDSLKCLSRIIEIFQTMVVFLFFSFLILWIMSMGTNSV